ncbi:tRNA pseudouridine synthase-like 1 isoform X1 [Anarhichas minor]|uniref:tRNA pseudouridine synthase-like 1 isoform X1 n=1 Tax=Anarhichas minor TaxID=65739 RepID=UPI003F73EFC5
MHNNWARYLVFFQYIGTHYRGAVKVPPNQLVRKGVQDHLEDAIRRLRPLNPVSLSVSSRTDTGVHALSNSAHFDLQRMNDKPPFTEDVLVEALNFHLKAEQIRITRAHRVPDDFHARFRARSRTYVYRIALGISHHSLLPLTERDLCWNLRNHIHLVHPPQSVSPPQQPLSVLSFICLSLVITHPHLSHCKKYESPRTLDVEAMREAAALLVGTQDFSSFRAVNSDIHFKSPVKTLNVASVQPGSSFVHAHFHREIPFWELTFTSRSFLYKQVRRMTGALVAVGRGQLSVPQLQEILEARDSLAYPQGLAAPANGLFLTRVDYRETDLQLSQQTPEEQFVSSGNSED